MCLLNRALRMESPKQVALLTNATARHFRKNNYRFDAKQNGLQLSPASLSSMVGHVKAEEVGNAIVYRHVYRVALERGGHIDTSPLRQFHHLIGGVTSALLITLVAPNCFANSQPLVV